VIKETDVLKFISIFSGYQVVWCFSLKSHGGGEESSRGFCEVAVRIPWKISTGEENRNF
jgi:hypothetical protein